MRNELIITKPTEVLKEDVESVRKAMYDRKRKHYPTFPNSLDEVVEQLKKYKQQDFFQLNYFI